MGVRWSHFLNKSSSLKIKKVRFRARMGVHLGRPAVSITAQGQFVVLRHLELEHGALRARLMGGTWKRKNPMTMVYTEYACGGAGNLNPSNPIYGYRLDTALAPPESGVTWNEQILNIKDDEYVLGLPKHALEKAKAATKKGKSL